MRRGFWRYVHRYAFWIIAAVGIWKNNISADCVNVFLSLYWVFIHIAVEPIVCQSNLFPAGGRSFAVYVVEAVSRESIPWNSYRFLVFGKHSVFQFYCIKFRAYSQSFAVIWAVCIIFAVITFNRVSIFLSWYNRRFVGIGMGVAGGISAYCSQSYPLTAGRFLIVDLVVGGIGSWSYYKPERKFWIRLLCPV